MLGQYLPLLALPDAEIDDFLGPAPATAVDGESVFVSGVVVKLFGTITPRCPTTHGQVTHLIQTTVL